MEGVTGRHKGAQDKCDGREPHPDCNSLYTQVLARRNNSGYVTNHPQVTSLDRPGNPTQAGARAARAREGARYRRFY